jgi:hypothetical protein
MNDPFVTIAHVRASQLCARGLREWLKRYNLDYMRFLRGEYRASEIEATQDALGIKVAAFARKEVLQ